jgi:hypothetical protein
MSSTILLALASALALQPDNAVFPQGLTCHGAAYAELQYGSPAPATLDRALALNAPFVFQRPFRGTPASVVYLCNSDRVQARLIYVQFASQEAATAAFQTYADAFTLQFGVPCEPPKSVSLPQGQEATATPGNSTLDIRWVEWKARPGAITRLTLLPIGRAQLLVETYETSIKKPPAPSNDAVSVQAQGTGSCGQDE